MLLFFVYVNLPIVKRNDSDNLKFDPKISKVWQKIILVKKMIELFEECRLALASISSN
jgi:hypothetical protein